MNLFKNKTILITGASSGIGKSLALELSSKGYELILSSRNIDLLNDVADNVSKLGGKVHVIQMDIKNSNSVEELFVKSKKLALLILLLIMLDLENLTKFRILILKIGIINYLLILEGLF